MSRLHVIRAILLDRSAMTGLLAVGILLGSGSIAWTLDSHWHVPTEWQGVEPQIRVVAQTVLHGQQPYPGRTVVSEIHNAPGWQPLHSYTYHIRPYTRIVNGPGWKASSGTFNPGEALNAYQLTSTGTCTSGDRGGPRSTDDNIIDGTCTWRYLSHVDYISITGWAFDNQHWKRDTAYLYGDYIVSGSPLRAYEQVNSAGCRSVIGPTGTASGSGTTFPTTDGCQWRYWADVLYSSEKSYIPTQRYLTPGKLTATDQMKANYEAEIWNDREYVAGKNGEATPIRLQAHFDYTQDGFPYSAEGDGISCNLVCYHFIVAAAPGESFADSLTTATPLTGYDPKNGVAIRNPTMRLTDGFEIRDNYVDLIGLQLKSDLGIGVGGGETHGGNSVTIRNSLVEGGSRSDAAINLDTSMLVANSLVVAHGLYGIVEDYPGTVLHSTLVNPDRVTNSVAIEVGLDWMFLGETVSNTALFGFAHAAASTANPKATDWRGITWLGGNNATDAMVGDSGSLPFGRGVATVGMLPKTLYGISAAAAFRSFPGDYRLASRSPLIGTGSAFGAFNPACKSGKPCSAIFTFDSPDIIGTLRPQAKHYDIGAWQSCNSASRDCRE
jgi:hypothetical protein